MKRLFIYLALLCAATVLRAQSLKTWTMADLARRSDIVCAGTVLKVEVVEEKKAEDILNYTPPPPKRETIARIKVTSRIKGNVPDEIELHYPAHEEQRLSLSPDQAGSHIQLQPDKVYCLYLKRVDGEIWYVSALDGEEEDGASAQQTGAVTLLSKEDAVQVATVEYLKADPAAVITPKLTDATCTKGALPVWIVRFYSDTAVDGKSWDASISVNQDKSIDDLSAIYGRTYHDYNKALIGKRFEFSVLSTRSPVPLSVIGLIQIINIREITMETHENGVPVIRSYPKSAILGMHPLDDARPGAPAQ